MRGNTQILEGCNKKETCHIAIKKYREYEDVTILSLEYNNSLDT